MANENEESLEIDETETGEDEIETGDSQEDEIDYKAKFIEAQGRLKRLQTKMSKSKEEPKEKEKSNKTNNGELGYAEKAYLRAEGVKGSDEFNLVREYIANTGKSLEEVLESKHFQNDLKDLRDEKSVKEALPNGTKRAGGAARDSVEYWIAKGELPPVSDPELRRKVVNAKIQTKKNSGMFYNS